MKSQARMTSDPYNGPTWTEKVLALGVLAVLALFTVAGLWFGLTALLLVQP